jgi:hypothetical protein
MVQMKKLNVFFFGEEEISLHDFLWFYGFYAFVISLTMLVCIPAWLQLLFN